MTERVRAELTRARVTAGCCRRAELVGVLRFAGQLHPMAGRVVVTATVGSLAIAARLQRGLYDDGGAMRNSRRAQGVAQTRPGSLLEDANPRSQPNNRPTNAADRLAG